MLLHQLDIAQHGCFVNRLAAFRMVFMPVSATDQQRFTIQFQQPLFNRDLTEADVKRFGFHHATVACQQADHRAVKRR